MVFVDDDGQPTEAYPFNPNGSPGGLAGLCSPDGRHLAMIDLAAFLKLLLYVSLIGCVFFPFGIAQSGQGLERYVLGFGLYLIKLAVGGTMLGVFEMSIAKMRVFRVPNFLGAAFMLSLLGVLLLFVSQGM